MNNIVEMTEEEQIAQHYKALGDSVWLINAVITGTGMSNDTQEDKADCIKRNVDHLTIMKAKDFWTSEDFTDIDAAIVSGNNYLLAK